MVFAPSTFQGPILYGNPTQQRSVVDSCSTDRSRELIENHLRARPWIAIIDRQNRGFRARGGTLRHLRGSLEVISRREAA